MPAKRSSLSICSAQRLSASQLRSRAISGDINPSKTCSTPFGITASITHGTIRPAAPGHTCAQRLSASQLRSRPFAFHCLWESWCSTPFGITASITVHHSLKQPTDSCAQRLSASQLRSRIWRGPRLSTSLVLNAFRHHSFDHFLPAKLHQVFHLCSTPFGITASITVLQCPARARTLVLNAFRHHSFDHELHEAKLDALEECSTPFGITASITGPARVRSAARPSAQRLSASQLRSLNGYVDTDGTVQCSTPFGITASITKLANDGTCTPTSAQRLSASQLRSPQTRIMRTSSLRCAQRLSASQLRSRAAQSGGRGGTDVLNAFRHHSFDHSRRSSGCNSGVWCSTPFGITASITAPCRIPGFPQHFSPTIQESKHKAPSIEHVLIGQRLALTLRPSQSFVTSGLWASYPWFKHGMTPSSRGVSENTKANRDWNEGHAAS